MWLCLFAFLFIRLGFPVGSAGSDYSWGSCHFALADQLLGLMSKNTLPGFKE